MSIFMSHTYVDFNNYTQPIKTDLIDYYEVFLDNNDIKTANFDYQKVDITLQDNIFAVIPDPD